jgi:hypothetical protein
MARFRRNNTNGTNVNGTSVEDPTTSTSKQQEVEEECRRRSRSGSRLFLELSARRSSYFAKFMFNIDEVLFFK